MTWLGGNPQNFSALYVPFLNAVFTTYMLTEENEIWRHIFGARWDGFIERYRTAMDSPLTTALLRNNNWHQHGYIAPAEQERLINIVLSLDKRS
jgi:hypothetical protein